MHNTPYKLLILEDDIDLARQWLKAFNEPRFTVQHALNFKAAKALCLQQPFDAVICDMFIQNNEGELMKQGGYSLITYLRGVSAELPPGWGKQVPLIVVSGAPCTKEYPMFNFGSYCGELLTMLKPFSPEELVEKVMEALQHSQAPSN